MSEFNTADLRAIGAVVLEMTIGPTVAAAEDVQQDAIESERNGDNPDRVVSSLAESELAKRQTGQDGIDVREYFSEPLQLGSDLIRELEAIGYRLEKVR